jgi:hypothetical protein
VTLVHLVPRVTTQHPSLVLLLIWRMLCMVPVASLLPHASAPVHGNRDVSSVLCGACMLRSMPFWYMLAMTKETLMDGPHGGRCFAGLQLCRHALLQVDCLCPCAIQDHRMSWVVVTCAAYAWPTGSGTQPPRCSWVASSPVLAGLHVVVGLQPVNAGPDLLFSQLL